MELIVQDIAGIHNADLDQTRARLIKGGSWKRQRIVCIIPASDTIPARVYLSHISLGFPPNNSVFRILALGQEVGEAYSNAIQSVLDHPELSQWEYILTMEHDNLVPSDGVVKLLEHMEAHPEFACIGGAYWTKGPNGVFQAWGDPKDPALNFRPQLPDPNGGLVECCGTGMGFNLWRMSMFRDERLRKPWFKTLKDNTGFATQDLYAWTDFRKYGYRCAIACDVKVGHLDSRGDFGPADTVW
jgi:hypothetical protein